MGERTQSADPVDADLGSVEDATATSAAEASTTSTSSLDAATTGEQSALGDAAVVEVDVNVGANAESEAEAESEANAEAGTDTEAALTPVEVDPLGSSADVGSVNSSDPAVVPPHEFCPIGGVGVVGLAAEGSPLTSVRQIAAARLEPGLTLEPLSDGGGVASDLVDTPSERGLGRVVVPLGASAVAVAAFFATFVGRRRRARF